MEMIVNSTSKLAEALSKAQAKIKAPPKNRTVDYKDKNGRRIFYKYADLADVIECVREPLSENGLCIVHMLVLEGDVYGLKTSLLHSSGEKIDSWYPLPHPVKQAIRAQDFGSALTYARRYSLSSLVGIASEEDDDGASAPEVTPPPQPKPEIKNHAPQPNKGNYKPRPIESIPQYYQGSQQFADTPLSTFDDTLPDDFFNDGPSTNFDHEMALKDLYDTVDQSGLTNDEVKKIINSTCGPNKKSKDLTIDEIKTVIKFVNVMKNK